MKQEYIDLYATISIIPGDYSMEFTVMTGFEEVSGDYWKEFEGHIKWDGCINYIMFDNDINLQQKLNCNESMIHFCGFEGFTRQYNIFKELYKLARLHIVHADSACLAEVYQR